MKKSEIQNIQSKIYTIRDTRVMLDFDLAELYGVETRALNQAVKRNRERFPDDFMFQFTEDELENWRSQFVTSNPDLKMGLRRKPYAFTEQGVAMLSSVLKSGAAIQMNIQIIRTFVKMRQLISGQSQILKRLVQLERQVAGQDKSIAAIFEAIRQLLEMGGKKERRKIGF